MVAANLGLGVGDHAPHLLAGRTIHPPNAERFAHASANSALRFLDFQLFGFAVIFGIRTSSTTVGISPSTNGNNLVD
jgi:hypothetical protein